MTRKSLLLLLLLLFLLLKRNHQLAKYLPKEHLGTPEFFFTSKISPQKENLKNLIIQY
jgi:hypothetical protein